MKPRQLRDGVQWMGAVDWNRRLFDSLIPLPDGTSYNAYLVRGTEKTALIDAVDPAMLEILKRHLSHVDRVDYIIAQHAEQDHAGGIPFVMEKYPEAIVICSPKAKDLLITHLDVPENKIRTVADGESLSLGGKTLKFIHTPWVHWPETMSTYLAEDRIVFTCDFLGAHIASSELFAGDDIYVIEAAKRYYAEIMMPFRSMVRSNLKKIRELQFDLIAPSHGQIYDKPERILAAYEDWSSDRVENRVVLPYVSMHGSTELMVDHLVAALAERGVAVQKFELTTTDIGKLAMALVDAATIVIGAPTVHMGPHPAVFSATHLANALRPKLKYAAIIGSYGWSTQVVERISGLIPNLKVEVLGTVLCRGLPRAATFAELDALADAIRAKHAAL
ncbi:MAG: FprA family A-type flavoprotein [Kiritimatiellae bacterium]|nr:FprA family A-type flavoprotein [Kiritimatiellia bacterium]HPC19711.1 FprA family A-type flavoprotein [Kiritimatiellia bacterium]HQQ60763.1 FprA family A-type flavoprotein [Kiritimatiellia bacterium]